MTTYAWVPGHGERLEPPGTADPRPPGHAPPAERRGPGRMPTRPSLHSGAPATACATGD